MLLICWYVLLEYTYYKPVIASGRVGLDLVYSDVVKVVFFTLGVSVRFFLMEWLMTLNAVLAWN